MSSNPVSVGVFLTNQHKPGRDLVAALDEQYRMVRFARDNGWDSIWAGQHYLPETLSMPQPVPFLARLSAEAGEMRVGIGILLLVLQNPLHIAETYASLDAITGGRLIFGVGLGYRDIEYNAFGIERSEVVRRFEANLDIVSRLWTEETVTADLPWCQLDEARLLVKPVQQPRPAIWMAANADAAVRRAARLSDAWLVNPHATHETIERQIELFNTTRAEAGLPAPAESPAMREIFCAPTREEAVESVRPYLEAKYSAYADWGQDKALPGDENFRIDFDELAAGRFVIGTPDDCLEQLVRWRDVHGINHFVLRTEWVGMPTELALGSMQLLTDEVLPVLRDGS